MDWIIDENGHWEHKEPRSLIGKVGSLQNQANYFFQHINDLNIAIKNLKKGLLADEFINDQKFDRIEGRLNRLENSIEILSKRIKELEEKESKTSPIIHDNGKG